MSDLRIAVLGVGMMGADHVARITSRISGAAVTVVNDYLPEKAAEVAAAVPGARVANDPFDAIADDDVDAILLATPGPTHEKQLLACLEHRKPVLCEKPLTTEFDVLARGGAPRGGAGHTADSGRLHASLRPGVPTAEDTHRRRRAGPAAGDALRAPQPDRATEFRLRDGRQGLTGARGRRDALPAGRGDRLGADHPARGQSRGAGGTSGPADRDLPDDERPPRRRRAFRHDRCRLRSTDRGRRRTRQRHNWSRCRAGA